MDAGANGGRLDAEGGSALDAVIASERRAELFQTLGVLSKRQRRVFLLYALDGWTCAEIAEAEGISAHAVHHLLSRARKKVRSLNQRGPLPAIVLPFSWLSWKIRQTEERTRSFLGSSADGFSSICAKLACLGVLTMVVVASSDPIEPSEHDDPIRSEEVALSAIQPVPPKTVLANIGASAKHSVELQQSVVDPADSLLYDVINPNQNATPEDTLFGSLTTSPNYESDHTVLALGYCRGCVGNTLFVSHDGGGSWKPQSSLLLAGASMVLPPNFPQDPRMFVLSESLGLQQSDDGGEIFRTVSPLVGRSLAISPSFGRGDSRVFIGGKTLFEYDAGTGVTRPGSLAIPPSRDISYSSVAISPGYPSDPTVFVSEVDHDASFSPRYDQTTLYRCGVVCDEKKFPVLGPMKLRLSPRFHQDGLAYAFAYRGLFVSKDGAQTFREVQFPLPDWPDYGAIRDVAIGWNAPSDHRPIFVSLVGAGATPGIYRSLDEGGSWNKTQVDLPGFDYGADKLIVTPTGLLLATGMDYGIACSEDKGQSWAPRCTPEL